MKVGIVTGIMANSEGSSLTMPAGERVNPDLDLISEEYSQDEGGVMRATSGDLELRFVSSKPKVASMGSGRQQNIFVDKAATEKHQLTVIIPPFELKHPYPAYREPAIAQVIREDSLLGDDAYQVEFDDGRLVIVSLLPSNSLQSSNRQLRHHIRVPLSKCGHDNCHHM